MRATILHDEHGKILALSKAVDLKKAGSKFIRVGLVPGRGQRMLEIDLTDLESKPLRRIHEEYRVDVPTSTLVRRTDLYTSESSEPSR